MAKKAQQASLAIDFGRIRLAHDSRTKQFGDFSNTDRITTDYRIEYAHLPDGQRLQFWKKGKGWLDEQPSPLTELHQLARSRNKLGFYRNSVDQYVRLVDRNSNFSRYINFNFSLLGYSNSRISSNQQVFALAQDTGKDGDNLTTNPQIVSNHKSFDAVQFYVNGAWQDEQPTPRYGRNILTVRLVHRHQEILSHTPPYSFGFDYLNLPAPKIVLPKSSSADSDNLIIQDTKFKFSNLVRHKKLGTAWIEYQVDDEWLRELPNLSPGDHSIPVRQRLSDGHISPIEKLNFTLAQSVVELPKLEIKLKNDTGSSDTDRRTHDGELKIGGHVNGAIVEYLWSDNEWHEKAPVPEKGKNSIQVRQRDAEGNTSDSTKFEFTLLELIKLPKLEIKLKNDTGNSDTDRRTHDGELKIGGRANGAIVEYLWSDNEWHDKAPVPEKGKNNIQVRQKDAEGNLSEISSFEFTLLTKRDLQSLVISLKNDTGWHESNPEWGSDRITTDPALQISGRAEGAEIEYKFDQHSSDQAGRNGKWLKWQSKWDDDFKWANWEWDYPVDFGGDINAFSDSVENTIHFRQVDADGNRSKETSFTFDFYPYRNRNGGFPSPSLSVNNDISYNPGHEHNTPRTTDYQLVTSSEPKEGEFYEWKGPAATAWSHAYPEFKDFEVGAKNTVQVRRRDFAGNISIPKLLTFELSPKPSIPSAPILSLKNDTGVDGDNITSKLELVASDLVDGALVYHRVSYRSSDQPGVAQPSFEDWWFGPAEWDFDQPDVINQGLPGFVIDENTEPGYYSFEMYQKTNSDVGWISSPISSLSVQLIADRPVYTPNKKPETLPYQFGHQEDTGLGAIFVMKNDKGASQVDKRTNPNPGFQTLLFELLPKDAQADVGSSVQEQSNSDGSGYQYQMNGSSWRRMEREVLADKVIWTFPTDSNYWKGENVISIRRTSKALFTQEDIASAEISDPYVYQWYWGDDTSDPAVSASQQSIEYDLDEDVVEYWEETGLGFKVKLKDDLGYSSTDKVTSSDQLEIVFTDQVDGNFTIEYKHSQADEWSLLADAASFSVGESMDSSHSFGSVSGANTLLLRRINSDGSESDPYSFAYTYDVGATSAFSSDQLTGNSLASTFSNALPESSVERFSLFSRFSLTSRPAFRDEFVDSVTGFYPSTGDQLLMDRDWIQAKSRRNLLAVVDGRRAEKQASKSNASLVYNQKTGDLFLNGNGDRSGWGKPKIGGLIVELDADLPLHEANIVLV